MFTKEELKKQIRDMGIDKDDTVLIHTSMRAIGEVENGADGVIDAFCEVLSSGLFIVPTHTWDSIGSDNPVFDVRKEIPCIGALPRVAAKRQDGIRSLHPTHSVWAHGKGAEEFVKGEELAQTPCPVGFAWSRLADMNAKILLLGVGNDKNTFIHAIDELADIPDRLSEKTFDVTIIDHEGRSITHKQHHHHCSKTDNVSDQFVNFEKPFVKMGVQKFGTLGNAVVRIVDAKKCRDLVMKMYSRAKEDLCIKLMDIPESYYKD